MNLEEEMDSREDIVTQDMIQDILRREGWNLVQPDDENWAAFVEAVMNRYMQNDSKDSGKRLLYAVVSEYSSILHAACVADDVSKKEEAYSQLFKWIRRRVRLYGFREENEDIAHNVLITVFEKVNTISNPTGFLAYVARIIQNKLHEYRRYRSMRAGIEFDLVYDSREGIMLKEDTSQGILLEESKNETIVRLQNCFPRNASRQLEVLILLAIEGLTPQEVAQRLDISVAAVYTLFHRAKQNFRTHCLEEFQELIKELGLK